MKPKDDSCVAVAVRTKGGYFGKVRERRGRGMTIYSSALHKTRAAALKDAEARLRDKQKGGPW